MPEKNNALPLCLSKLSQLESEPERAVMSFYRIFKGRHDGGLSFRTIIQDLKALVGGKSTIFRLYELLAHYNESIHSDISCDACEMSPIVIRYSIKYSFVQFPRPEIYLCTGGYSRHKHCLLRL